MEKLVRMLISMMTFEEEIPGTKKIEGKWYFLFQNNIDIDPSQIMQF